MASTGMVLNFINLFLVTATGVEVCMMTLGASTRRGGNVMGMTIHIGNGENTGQFGVTTRICTECARDEQKNKRNYKRHASC